MRVLWLSAAIAFLIDQWSKFHVFTLLDLQTLERIEVIAPLLVFVKGMNTGVNFGLFADNSPNQRWFLIALSLALCAMLWYWARRNFHRPVEFASAGLIVGGALGNALDRVIFPGVRDFLNMSCCGINNPYVFNVADVFIFMGAAGLVFFAGDSADGKKPT